MYMANDNLSTVFFNTDKLGVLRGLDFYVSDEDLTRDDIIYFSELVSEVTDSKVSANKIYSCIYETKRGTIRYLKVGTYTLKCYSVSFAPVIRMFVY